MGGSQAAIFSTAVARWTTALVRKGRDPWPEGPVTTSRAGRGRFSVVWTVA